jgi:hypothetical protein
MFALMIPPAAKSRDILRNVASPPYKMISGSNELANGMVRERDV